MKKRDLLKKEKEEKQIQKCTFEPKTNKSKLLRQQYTPIQHRTYDILNKRKEKLKELKLQQVIIKH